MLLRKGPLHAQHLVGFGQGQFGRSGPGRVLHGDMLTCQGIKKILRHGLAGGQHRLHRYCRLLAIRLRHHYLLSTGRGSDRARVCLVHSPSTARNAPEGRIDLMYLIAIAWLYVALLAAVTDNSVVGGVLTFVFYGLAPMTLFLWLFGTPTRRRRQRQREANDLNDRAETDGDQ